MYNGYISNIKLIIIQRISMMIKLVQWLFEEQWAVTGQIDKLLYKTYILQSIKIEPLKYFYTEQRSLHLYYT